MKQSTSPRTARLPWSVIVMQLVGAAAIAWLVLWKGWPLWQAFGLVALAMAVPVLGLLVVLVLMTRREEWRELGAVFRHTLRDDWRALWNLIRWR
jgi:membrane protein YdbS with pleckstrin-like domain